MFENQALGSLILRQNYSHLSIVPSNNSVSKIPVTAPRMGNRSTVSSPEEIEMNEWLIERIE